MRRLPSIMSGTVISTLFKRYVTESGVRLGPWLKNHVRRI